MSELLQSGPHPDADQLNAFVEHALPAHEHQATLAHLAICADCRAVVTLSLPPHEDLLPQPEPSRRPWFLGWRLMWPIATAATLVVLAAITIHIRNVSIPPIVPAAPQLAANHVPPPMMPTQQPATTESKQRNTVATPPANPARKMSPAPQIAKPAVAPAPSPLPLQGRAVANLQALPPSTASTPSAGSATTINNVSANGAEIALDQNAAPDRLLQAKPADGKAAPAPRAAPPPLTLADVADNASIQPPPVRLTMNGLATLDLASDILRLHPLPSGQPALSIVTEPHQHQTLAVDIRGALFLTADSGEHWTPVVAQWPGRAMKVDVAYSTTRHVATLSGFSARAGTAGFAEGGSVGGPVIVSGGVAPSSLGGTVTDASGAIIPQATIIVSVSPEQLARIAKTDATGHYLVDGLVPGAYTVQADSPGFVRQQLSKVAVAPGKAAIANLTLQVGAATQTVTAAAPQLAPSPPLAKQKAAASSKVIPSQPIFEITTDTGEHWVSANGVTWKRK